MGSRVWGKVETGVVAEGPWDLPEKRETGDGDGAAEG